MLQARAIQRPLSCTHTVHGRSEPIAPHVPVRTPKSVPNVGWWGMFETLLPSGRLGVHHYVREILHVDVGSAGSRDLDTIECLIAEGAKLPLLG